MNAADLAAVMADYGDKPMRIRAPNGVRLVVGKIEEMGEGDQMIVDVQLTPAVPGKLEIHPPGWAPDQTGV